MIRTVKPIIVYVRTKMAFADKKLIKKNKNKQKGNMETVV